MANKSKDESKEKLRPAQSQDRQPGLETEMDPKPEYLRPHTNGSDKLKGLIAVVTGGDSGIGRAVSVAFAQEGAKVAILYKDETQDAKDTKNAIEEAGGACVLIPGDLGDAAYCEKAIDQTIKAFGQIDVLVNNAAEQHPEMEFTQIEDQKLMATYQTNILSMFRLTRAALPHLRKSKQAAIVNTTSVTAYRGSPGLIDYSSTKGAIVSFTRSLSGALAKDGIRVNAVAPGPIWTPLIPATFPPDKVATFGSDVPMKRAGEPWEVATCFVFLASRDASYLTGQVLHPNGGEIVNG
jgi:NAD(P)-dependent dehydrogenase (short-subunit alcohol dehydrogenase family)